jgi:hypothetical protein
MGMEIPPLLLLFLFCRRSVRPARLDQAKAQGPYNGLIVIFKAQGPYNGLNVIYNTLTFEPPFNI